MQIQWNWMLFLLAVILAGCGTPALNPNLYLSPESKGKLWGGEVHGGLSQIAKIQVSNGDEEFPTYSNPKLSSSANQLIGTGIEIWNLLDLYLNVASGAQNTAGMKYQFFGSPAENAKSGNFSMSGAGGLSFGSVSSRPEGEQDTTKVDYSGWDLRALFGYRTFDNALIYANPFWSHLAANIEVKSSVSTPLIPDGSGDMYGLTLGGRLEYLRQHLFFAGEISLGQMSWQRKKPTSISEQSFLFLPGATVGYSW